MAVDPRRRLVLEIAGLGLEVRTADPDIQVVAEPAHVPFLVNAVGSDCSTVVLAPTPDRICRRRGKGLPELSCIWRLEESEAGHLLTFRSPLFGADPYLAVEFDEEYRRGYGETLLGGPHLTEGRMHPFVHPFDEVLFLARLSRGRGVMVHACGISYHGHGILFLGTSGSGKSTTAQLWHDRGGVTVLSDGRVVIRPDGEGYRIYGTPWFGDAGCEEPGSAPLSAVFILEQAPRNRVQDMTPSSAVAQMMVRAFPAMWDRRGLDFAVRFLTRLAEQIQVRRLYFTADPSSTEAALAVLDLDEAV
jgi:hypothetical protein